MLSSMYSESGYGLLPCCHIDIIYSMWQSIVFKLVCPEKILRNGFCVNAEYEFAGVYLHIFLDSNGLPWNIAFFVSFVYRITLKLK